MPAVRIAISLAALGMAIWGRPVAAVALMAVVFTLW